MIRKTKSGLPDKRFHRDPSGRKGRHASYGGVEIPKDDWILDNYKKPIKRLANGFGYMGVVTRSKDGERVRSHCDGLFYEHINNAHCKKFGFATSKEYKEKFGISNQTPLMGKTRLKVLHDRSMEYFQRNGASNLKHNRDNGRKMIQANKDRMGTKMSLEVRNERGTCPDQLLDKINQLAKKLGHTPSADDFKMEYNKKYMGILGYYFGSWVKAVKLAGLIPVSIEYPRTYTEKELLERVRIFYEETGYTPLTKDFGFGVLPSLTPYKKHWRTLNAMRLNAGVPLVMSLKKGLKDKAMSLDADPEVFDDEHFNFEIG